MINLKEELREEREKLYIMIENIGLQSDSNIILEQSKKVDRLVTAYQNMIHYFEDEYNMVSESMEENQGLLQL